MSKTVGVENAIQSSRMQIMDVVAKRSLNKNGILPDYEGYVMPLPTLFE
jgi:hypothetical protein